MERKKLRALLGSVVTRGPSLVDLVNVCVSPSVCACVCVCASGVSPAATPIAREEASSALARRSIMSDFKRKARS